MVGVQGQQRDFGSDGPLTTRSPRRGFIGRQLERLISRVELLIESGREIDFLGVNAGGHRQTQGQEGRENQLVHARIPKSRVSCRQQPAAAVPPLFRLLSNGNLAICHLLGRYSGKNRHKHRVGRFARVLHTQNRRGR